MSQGPKIIATRLSAPENEGYADKVELLDPVNGQQILSLPRFGTNPNGVSPKTGQPWYECEGQLAPGTYKYRCWNSPKHGKCLMLNGLGACATTRPDPANGGAMFARDVEVHTGFRSEDDPANPGKPWRGSLCCQTVDPDDKEVFWSHFEIGNEGDYVLLDGLATA